MDLLLGGITRQMDLLSASLPDEIPSVSFQELGESIASNFPARLPESAGKLGFLASADKIIKDIISTRVSVALTPLGNADAPLDGQFVQPCQLEMSVLQLLNFLKTSDDTHVFYMQSQDDNLNKEFAHCKIVPRDLESLKRQCPILSSRGPPAASNLWIGGAGTRSMLHNDNYDNIFVQLSGKKRVYLIPPSHVYGVHEQFLQPKRYVLDENNELVLAHDPEAPCKVLFPTVDPRDPSTQDESFKLCKVYVVDLNPGDALFIPALWYHQVEITSKDVNLSANYWFKPAQKSALWPMWDYLRLSSLVTRGYYDEDYFCV